MGSEMCIRDRYPNIENLVLAPIEELETIDDIGPTVSSKITTFFANKTNVDLIKRLRGAGVRWSIPSTINNANLFGKTFVLTGALESLSRREAKDRLLELGAKVSATVSKNTDFVVSGPGSGSKLSRAVEYGVKILDEEEFLALLP